MKTNHYWAIHKHFFWRLWNDLSSRQRDIISHDAEHKTNTYREFEARLTEVVERYYNDPDAAYNDPASFKYPYRVVEA